MNWNTYFVMMAIFLVTVIAVGSARHHNGRLEMCEELGLFYTNEKECLSCEDTGRVWEEGKCIIPSLPENNVNKYFEERDNG